MQLIIDQILLMINRWVFGKDCLKKIIPKDCLKMIPQLCFGFTSSQNCKKILDTYNEQLTKLKNETDKKIDFQQSVEYKRIQEQLQKDLINQSKIEKQTYIRQYITKFIPNNIKSEQSVKSQNIPNYIPKNIVLKKLYYGDRQILLCGVKNQDQQHSIYVKKLIQALKIKRCIINLSPDLPFFIKTQTSFVWQWKRLLEGKVDAKFYVNPLPRSINQITIKNPHIDAVKHALFNSDQFHQHLYSVLKLNSFSNTFQPYSILTPLITHGVQQVYFSGLPLIKQRQEQVKAIPLKKLRDLMQILKLQKLKPQSNFDSSLLFPSHLMKQKMKHITNILRQVSDHSKDRVILICKSDEVQHIANYWKNMSGVPQFHFYLQENPWPKITLLQFVQKLVILQFLLQPTIHNYYIKYQSFPYSCDKVIGGKQHLGKIFMIWNYYYDAYLKSFTKE